jgi:hypothetical protein
MRNLPNSVLPRKVYGIYFGHKELGEVVADNVHEAFEEGRKKWGKQAGAAILKGSTQREPMFLN